MFEQTVRTGKVEAVESYESCFYVEVAFDTSTSKLATLKPSASVEKTSKRDTSIESTKRVDRFRGVSNQSYWASNQNVFN